MQHGPLRLQRQPCWVEIVLIIVTSEVGRQNVRAQPTRPLRFPWIDAGFGFGRRGTGRLGSALESDWRSRRRLCQTAASSQKAAG
jgi:hypothetical protein